MKYDVTNTLSVSMLVVSRWGRSSDNDPRFQSSVGFKKAKPDELSRIIFPINDYLQQRCKTEQGNRLFDLVAEAASEDSQKTIFGLSDVQRIGDRLTRFVQIFNLEHFEKYIEQTSSAIAYPPDIAAVYVQDQDMSRSPEKTYTSPQYRDLCALSTLIRATYPLWYHFMLVRQEDPARFLRIWRLIGDVLSLYPDSRVFEAYRKVGEYVNAQLVSHERFGQLKDRLLYNHVMSGEDVKDHVTATAVFTKLFGFNWLRSETGNTSNPISFIYSSCQQQLNGSGKPQEGVSGKRVSAGEGSEGGGSTVFECFRGRHRFNQAQEAMLRHSLSQYGQIYQTHTERELDMVYFEAECVRVRDQLLQGVHELHLDLLGLFIAKYETPLALQLLAVEQVVELMVLASMVLVESGHSFLGALMTSYHSSVRASVTMGSRGQIPKPLVEALKVIYKEQVVDGKVPNITDHILLLVAAVESKVWIPTALPELLGTIGATDGYLNTNIIDLPSTIAKFVIFTQGETNALSV